MKLRIHDIPPEDLPVTKRRTLSLALLVVSLAGPLSAATPPVAITRSGDTISVTIDEEPFATLNAGADAVARPYWHPIQATNGVLVSATRPSDHLHHTGLYIGVEHVNGLDYWGSKEVMRAAKVPAGDTPGKVVSREVEIVKAMGDPSQVKLVNDWIGTDGKPALRETTVVTIHSNGLMAFDITLEAIAKEVTFEDTKEGFFAFRFPETLTVKSGSGKIVNPAGEEGEKPSWGKPNPWLDYFGEDDGKTAGVALFDHPRNFRPSRYHVRAYGLFAVSPFGEGVYSNGAEEAKPVHLQQGEKLHLRYAAYVHVGDTKAADVAGVYAGWAKAK